MNSEADLEAYLKQLDTNGLQQLQDRVRQQLVALIDDWFEKHEAGDEHSDGTSNLLVVELAGTSDDPHIDVGHGLVVFELTREGPFQADTTDEFIADEEAADYSKFTVEQLLKMLQRLEREAAENY